MRRTFISLTVIVLFITPQVSFGDDVADLKAAHQKFYQALTSLDAETLASIIYPGAINFGPNAAFPSVLPTENVQVQLTPSLKGWFSNS